jgi:hypothetical protein
MESLRRIVTFTGDYEWTLSLRYLLIEMMYMVPTMKRPDFILFSGSKD